MSKHSIVKLEDRDNAKWAVGYPNKEGIVHTWPINQTEKHCLEGATCFCSPKVMLEEGITVISHNIVQ
jgi:hypothetical protein